MPKLMRAWGGVIVAVCAVAVGCGRAPTSVQVTGPPLPDVLPAPVESILPTPPLPMGPHPPSRRPAQTLNRPRRRNRLATPRVSLRLRKAATRLSRRLTSARRTLRSSGALNYRCCSQPGFPNGPPDRHP